MPLEALRKEYRKNGDLSRELDRLAHRFKVSTLIILRRVHDIDKLPKKQFSEAYDAELRKSRAVKKSRESSFYPTEVTRVGERFARALIASTLEGSTSFTESFRMLGFWKTQTFNELARRLGVAP